MGVLLLFGLHAWGQIHETPAHRASFSVPPPQLRPAPTAPERTVPRFIPGSDSSTIAAEATTSARSRDLELAEKFDRAVVLNRPSRLSQEGPERWMRDIFEPEVFQLGHFTLGSSFATAIKRRNPLCLLNPYVFWATF